MARIRPFVSYNRTIAYHLFSNRADNENYRPAKDSRDTNYCKLCYLLNFYRAFLDTSWRAWRLDCGALSAIKSSILKIAFLFVFSFTVLAEETTKAESSTDKTKDAEESQAIIEQTEAVPENGSNKTTQSWIPSAVKYDWVQLTSNEWLKGEIKGMYDDSLEFDSDKLDLLNIDWDDVKILRSRRVNNINIDEIDTP